MYSGKNIQGNMTFLLREDQTSCNYIMYNLVSQNTNDSINNWSLDSKCDILRVHMLNSNYFLQILKFSMVCCFQNNTFAASYEMADNTASQTLGGEVKRSIKRYTYSRTQSFLAQAKPRPAD